MPLIRLCSVHQIKPQTGEGAGPLRTTLFEPEGLPGRGLKHIKMFKMRSREDLLERIYL